MSDLRKAAEMSIEAIMDGDVKDKAAAVYALRQALAMEKFSEVNQEIEEALKQPKREWVGLTDEEVECWRGNYDFFDSALVREIEAKLKEKNT